MTRGLVAVVPVFNEAATVGAIVSDLARVCPVIVVDDASTDGSGVRAAAAGAACVIRHARRTGKGAALRAGFTEALRRGAESIATLDGDGQHDPADLPRLVETAHCAPSALVIGDRLAGREGDRIPLVRHGAIRIADCALRWLTRAPVRDTQCGFRIYPAALLRAAPLSEEGFVLETEALVRAARAGCTLLSVPVRPVYPPGRASRFRALADGAQVAVYIVREVLRETGRRWLGDSLARGRVPAPVSEA